MRVCYVVNPAAGRGRTGKLWPLLGQRLKEEGHEFDVLYTGHPREATELARRAAREGYDRVAAVGGDGTACEVGEGLVGTDAALVVVPSGTGNDLRKPLRVPEDPLAAARLAFVGAPRPIDVGQVGARYFLNVAGVGFDAEVAREVNRLPKYFGGTIPYLWGVAKKLTSHRSVPMRIVADGRVLEERVYLLALGNGQWYGAGMKITPDAVIDDGLFDVVYAVDFNAWDAILTVPKVYSGAHLGHPKLRQLRARRVEITADQPVAYHIDGEEQGYLPATFVIIPRALQVVVPPTP